MSDKVYLVDNSKKTFYYYTQKEWIQPPPFMGDSAIVIFRDTTMISHSQMDLSHPKRNLFKTSIWNLRKDGDNDYHYTYSFDNEDYREALEAI